MKVTLLGDSIRLNGYGTVVPQMLGEEFTVYQPTENCRYVKRTIRGLLDWASGIADSDIIHWNNGCWDISDYFGDGPFTPIEDYERDVLRLAALLQQRARMVIFATTTPQKLPDDHPYNQAVRAYNAAVVPKLQARGVLINDLYTTVAAHRDIYLREDLLHLSEEGIHACGEQVCDCIRQAAVKLQEGKLSQETPLVLNMQQVW